MSIRHKQAQKAASISLDDDDPMVHRSVADDEPRTVPGKLMNLQGKYAQALEEIESLKNNAGPSGLVKVDIASIYKIKGRQRILTPTQRAELKANLKEQGLINPIILRPKNERGYELIAGHNRTDLWAELGYREIDAIFKEVDDEKAELFAFYTNLLADTLPDYEKYLGFKKRKDETGFDQVQLAEESGINDKTLSLLFRFEKLPDEAKAILNRQPNILGASAASKLVTASEAGRTKRVIEAVEKLAADPKYTQAQAVAYANRVDTAVGPRPAATVIRSGKKTFCEISSRQNTVTVKFGEGIAIATDWVEKFEAFVRNELAKESK